MNKLLIRISGGIITEVVSNNPDVEFIIQDYDNERVGDYFTGDRYSPDQVLSDTEFEQLIELEKLENS